MKNGFKKTIAILLAGSQLAACAALPENELRRVESAPSSLDIPSHKEVLDAEARKPIMVLPLDRHQLVPRFLERNDPIPDVDISSASFDNTPAWLALQAVLKDTGISLSRGNFERAPGLITAYSIGPSLRVAIDFICESGGIFCRYVEEGPRRQLHVSERETFMVELPPELIEGESTLVETVKKLTASPGHEGDVIVDKGAKVLIYSANQSQNGKVREFLRHMVQNRLLLVYETYIWQVRMNDDDQKGIGWRNLLASVGDLTMTATTPGIGNLAGQGALNFGAVFSGSDLTIDVLANVLRRKGELSTVATPRITLMSGSQANFNDSTTIRYISRIGQVLTSNSNNTNNNSFNNTTETEELTTGTSLKVYGEFFNDAIHSKIEIKRSTLLGFEDFPTGQNNVTLRLPTTAERSVDQTVMIRPGDILILAGFNEATSEREVEGALEIDGRVPLPNRWDKSYGQQELVIAMIPRVIMYRHAEEIAAAKGLDPYSIDARRPSVALERSQDTDSGQGLRMEAPGTGEVPRKGATSSGMDVALLPPPPSRMDSVDMSSRGRGDGNIAGARKAPKENEEKRVDPVVPDNGSGAAPGDPSLHKSAPDDTSSTGSSSMTLVPAGPELVNPSPVAPSPAAPSPATSSSATSSSDGSAPRGAATGGDDALSADVQVGKPASNPSGAAESAPSGVSPASAEEASPKTPGDRSGMASGAAPKKESDSDPAVAEGVVTDGVEAEAPARASGQGLEAADADTANGPVVVASPSIPVTKVPDPGFPETPTERPAQKEVVITPSEKPIHAPGRMAKGASPIPDDRQGGEDQAQKDADMVLEVESRLPPLQPVNEVAASPVSVIDPDLPLKAKDHKPFEHLRKFRPVLAAVNEGAQQPDAINPARGGRGDQAMRQLDSIRAKIGSIGILSGDSAGDASLPANAAGRPGISEASR